MSEAVRMWYQFKLTSGNFVIVVANSLAAAKEKFLGVWPKEPKRVKVLEKSDDFSDMPEGAVETLYAD